MSQQRGRTMKRTRSKRSKNPSPYERAFKGPYIRVRKYRPKKPLALKEHNFVERNVLENTITVAPNEATAVGLFRSFAFADIRQVAQYADIFEYYRINKVVVTFRYKSAGAIPASNNANVRPLVNEINPMLIFKVDHNDVNSDSIDVLKDSMKTRKKVIMNDNSEFSITLKPAVQTELFRSALSTATAPKWGQWISTIDDAIPHYGLKVYAVGSNNADSLNGNIHVTYKTYFTCKCNE